MGGSLDESARWVVEIFEAFGYVGVALLVAAEVVIPPIPSEVILPLAGFLTSQGQVSFVGMVAAATVGSVFGALVLYAVGYSLGPARLRRFVDRYGRFLFVSVDDLERSQAWFNRHGARAVLIGRCVPLVRSLISVPAGLTRMPLYQFVLYTALGSGAWNGLLIGVGWALGEQWDLARQYARLFGQLALVLMAGGIVWLLWRGWSRRGAAPPAP